MNIFFSWWPTTNGKNTENSTHETHKKWTYTISRRSYILWEGRRSYNNCGYYDVLKKKISEITNKKKNNRENLITTFFCTSHSLNFQRIRVTSHQLSRTITDIALKKIEVFRFSNPSILRCCINPSRSHCRLLFVFELSAVQLELLLRPNNPLSFLQFLREIWKLQTHHQRVSSTWTSKSLCASLVHWTFTFAWIRERGVRCSVCDWGKLRVERMFFFSVC